MARKRRLAGQTQPSKGKHKPGAAGRPDAEKPKFFIVGIGASAGGLAALEKFFDALEPHSGMAYVVVTHQHPGHGSLLQGLLSKHTPLKMFDILDGMKVEPNRVYLSQAGTNLSLLNGKFYLLEPDPHEAVRLPIDHFFRSLAQDRKDSAIGIILSGAGSDGTVGLKAIKSAFGFTLVQDPGEPEYSGMPRSAIAAQVADVVMPVSEMPARLKTFLRAPIRLMRRQQEQQQQQQQEIVQILPKCFAVLRERTGNDFSTYKQRTIVRRLERRMALHGLADPQDYLRYLQTHTEEGEALLNEFLIGVTSFFRDPETYESLADKAIASLLKSKQAGAGLRIWVPGCSTGEEAYSIAIMLQEEFDRRKKHVPYQIFATDLDSGAIETARHALYPAGIVEEVSPARMDTYFTKEDGNYRVRKNLRSQVIFAVHNFLTDPPFRRMDLISCRNVLIYLEPKAQRQLLILLHYALKPKGFLLLGSSEVITSCEDLFQVVDRKAKLFARRDGADPSATLPVFRRFQFAQAEPDTGAAVSPSEPRQETVPANAGGMVIQKFLLDHYAPASIIVNKHGEIIHIQGHTGMFLEPPPGAPTRNIVDMTRKGLRLHLESLLHQATLKQSDKVSRRGYVQVDGHECPVDITVKEIDQAGPLNGLLLVTFEKAAETKADVPKKTKGSGRGSRGAAAKMRTELQMTRERLQRSIEELEMSNEEFKATNEELQSTNEELQSTNEELETAKEELHSLNEELVSVNAELQGKVEELSLSNDDMANLFESTDVATIFLDNHLRIRRFTDAARQIFNLIPTDVGRPLSDLVSKLAGESVIRDAQEVLRTLIPRETELQAGNGKWYFARVLPFRTTQNVIAGVVMAFLDISHQKRVEQENQQARDYAESIVETVREPLLVLDANLRVNSANKAFYRTFRLKPEMVQGRLIYQLHDGQWDLPRLKELFESILPKDRVIEGFQLEHEFAGLGRRTLMINARRVEEDSRQPAHILVAIEDVTGPTPEPDETLTMGA